MQWYANAMVRKLSLMCFRVEHASLSDKSGELGSFWETEMVLRSGQLMAAQSCMHGSSRTTTTTTTAGRSRVLGFDYGASMQAERALLAIHLFMLSRYLSALF